jgi:hypothetical protein
MSDPTRWRERNDLAVSHFHPTYPLDGRETIYAPYEQHAPTGTVGEYLDAAKRVRDGDMTLPRDFDAYLAQRVPSARFFRAMNPGTMIDPYGKTTS